MQMIVRLLALSLLAFPGLLCLPVDAAATIYYVATDGDDTNPGTVNSPSGAWRNPRKCGLAASGVVSGDVCLIQPGAYLPVGTDFATVRMQVAGVTIQCQIQWSCTLNTPSTQTENAGIRVEANNVTVKWIDIIATAPLPPLANPQSYAGVLVTGGRTGYVITGNRLHDIEYLSCTASTSGFNGIFAYGASSGTIEKNLIYNIGRRAFGESSCSQHPTPSLNQNDHGLYILGAATIQNNIIHHAVRGFAIQLHGCGPGTGCNGGDGPVNPSYTIRNNTIDSSDTSNPLRPNGSIMFWDDFGTVTLTNNIIYSPQSAPYTTFSLVCGSIAHNFNLTNNSDADWFVGTAPSCASNGSSNIRSSTTVNFTNLAGLDYTLATGSAGIDTGGTVALTEDFLGNLRPVDGNADGIVRIDIGAYEKPPAGTLPDTTPPGIPPNVRVSTLFLSEVAHG